jgi:formamidopyrimidine-DNA glycosylase
MPELPEIYSRAREMDFALSGKQITEVTVLQPKCLNLSSGDFKQALEGARIIKCSAHGKWIFTETSQGWLLFNLGMGGEILLVPHDSLPEKHRLIFNLSEGISLSVNFWWFGYAHYVKNDALGTHAMTANLGPNALEINDEQLSRLISNRRGYLKSILLDQKIIAGIGNAYIHDILFLARLHPLRPAQTLSGAEIQTLVQAIQAGLRPALEKGGAFYEVNIYGQKGGFSMDDILVGYQEGKPCPICKTPIKKIRTGSTSSFICPACQPL